LTGQALTGPGFRRDDKNDGGGAVIDAIFERLTRAIERVLALASIVAVGLNFANVVDRYVLGRSILGADEVQIYIMVWMTFLGAVIVAWRNGHLRMDVLVKFLPERVQALLQATELVLIVLLAGLVFVQSSRYTWEMFALGETSNTAGIPMWLPHSAVAIGFGLIALIALWRGAQMARHKSTHPAQRVEAES